MNKTQIRMSAAVLGTLAVAGAGLATAPAQAQAPAGSTVTASASDTTPSSGQTFQVSGIVSAKGAGTPSTITVKTLRSGSWVPLTGATMHTDSAGHYTIRVILDAKGERQLRVVADPDGSAYGMSRTTFSVTVH
jgi:hypothetical protein